VSAHFHDRDGELHAEGLPVREIAAQVGTPFYLYSTAALVEKYRTYERAFAGHPTTICYALKANSNQAVIRTFAALGAGADVVSEGELRRALAAGIDPRRIVFAGVGKTRDEMAFALKTGILQFNIESEPELDSLSEVASALGLSAEVALRINPDVDARTHAKITTGKSENKFGVPIARARQIFGAASGMPGIKAVAISCHIGSQLTSMEPFAEAFARMAELTRHLKADGIGIRRLDLGGGIGVAYRDETPPDIAEYGAMAKRALGQLGCDFVIEPGRSLVAEAGVLVARAVRVKQGEGKTFVILDAAMNDLIRPTLYDAWMAIRPVTAPKPGVQPIPVDFVGPVCESGDYFAKDRPCTPLAAGDLVAKLFAGAYGAVMASTYNSRLLVPEVMVNGADFAVVRPRQTYEELIGLDRLAGWQTPPTAAARG